MRTDISELVRLNAAMAWEKEGKFLNQVLLTTGTSAVFDDIRRGFYLFAEADGWVVASLYSLPGRGIRLRKGPLKPQAYGPDSDS